MILYGKMSRVSKYDLRLHLFSKALASPNQSDESNTPITFSSKRSQQ